MNTPASAAASSTGSGLPWLQMIDPGQQVADQAQRLELDALVVLVALDPCLGVADAQAGVQAGLPLAEDDLLLSPDVARDTGAVPLLTAVRRGVESAGRVMGVDVDDHRLAPFSSKS